MQAGAARDIDAAYATFADGETSRKEVESLINDYVLFENFQGLKIERWGVYASPNTDRGKLTGTLSYKGGHTGRFEAEMVQVKGGWKIAKTNITVGRDKLQEYRPPTISPDPSPSAASRR